MRASIGISSHCSASSWSATWARADVAQFIRDVTTGKTATVERTKARGKAVVTGGAGTAARAVSFLGAILSFAVNEGIVETNVARGVKRKADEKRTRRLTEDEYRNCGPSHPRGRTSTERRGRPSRARASSPSRRVRLGEVVNLKWSEIDEPGGCFRLTDAEEGRLGHGRSAGAPLSFSRHCAASTVVPCVLPAVRGAGHFAGLPHAFKRMVKRSGLGGVTPHTMRHSFASMAGDLGYSEPTIAAILGHAAGNVTGRYVHHLNSVLVAAADRVAARVDAAMGGEAGDVVRFKAWNWMTPRKSRRQAAGRQAARSVAAEQLDDKRLPAREREFSTVSSPNGSRATRNCARTLSTGKTRDCDGLKRKDRSMRSWRRRRT